MGETSEHRGDGQRRAVATRLRSVSTETVGWWLLAGMVVATVVGLAGSLVGRYWFSWFDPEQIGSVGAWLAGLGAAGAMVMLVSQASDLREQIDADREQNRLLSEQIRLDKQSRREEARKDLADALRVDVARSGDDDKLRRVRGDVVLALRPAFPKEPRVSTLIDYLNQVAPFPSGSELNPNWPGVNGVAIKDHYQLYDQVFKSIHEALTASSPAHIESKLGDAVELLETGKWGPDRWLISHKLEECTTAIFGERKTPGSHSYTLRAQLVALPDRLKEQERLTEAEKCYAAEVKRILEREALREVELPSDFGKMQVLYTTARDSEEEELRPLAKELIGSNDEPGPLRRLRDSVRDPPWPNSGDPS